MPPRVSVIMPFRNMESFLEESIQSVRRQSWADWELLMIDDASTDGGPQIASRFVALDQDRVRLHAHPNREHRGASAARNLGLQHARGEYIALLDADDVWPDESLEERIQVLNARPDVGMVYGRHLEWYSWAPGGMGRRKDSLERLGVRAGHRIQGAALLRLALNNRTPMPATHCTLLRRSVVDRAGGFEEAFTFINTDQAFFAKVFLVTDVLPVDRCWGWYRRRPDSSSAVGIDQERESREVFLRWLEQFVSTHHSTEHELVRTVRSERWWLQRPHILRRWNRFFNRLPGRLRQLMPSSRWP